MKKEFKGRRTTLSLIKADVGSLCGHIEPSTGMMKIVIDRVGSEKGKLIDDFDVSYCGDDIAILLAHANGSNCSEIHKLCWDAFDEAGELADSKALYGAKQDLVADAFSCNIRGLGPQIAEMTFVERRAEPFITFRADKTDAGAFNLPFYLMSDPMYNSGILLSPEINEGFTYRIMDIEHTDGDLIGNFNTPEDLYKIAQLLRATNKYIVESIWSRATGEQILVASTTHLSFLNGQYMGKDDPVAIQRTQSWGAATGEALAPFSIAHYVNGFCRGSHTGPFAPVEDKTPVSWFDGLPQVSAIGFCVRNGKLSQRADLFKQYFWEEVRKKAVQKAIFMREQGFTQPAMLPIDDLEYTKIVGMLDKLKPRFNVVPKA